MPEMPQSSPSDQPDQPPSFGRTTLARPAFVSLATPQVRETLSRPQALVAYHSQEDCLLNLSGDYSYLSVGYYVSQDLESERALIHPTCAEVMDAYVMPLFLEKAKRAGLPISDYYISNGYFEPPVIVDTINPFMSRHSVVLKAAAQERIAKSLTRNFTYAISCQELPHRARVSHFHAVLGWSAIPKFRELAQAVWRTFGMPLAKVRVMTCSDGRLLLSGLQPLPFARLTEREQLFLLKMVTWRT
jgi:hypothetical protein